MQKLISTIILLTLASFSVGAYSEQPKQSICHEGKSITVAQPSVKSHLAHGDTLGSCLETPAAPKTMSSVVMMRCDGALVVSLNSSVNAGELPVESACSQLLADLLNNGLTLKAVTGGSGPDESGLLHLYTDYLLIGSSSVVVAP